MGNYSIKYFFIQKNGYCMEEYEDAFSINKEALVFAISDGATEATFSKEWAGILVECFTSNPTEYITDVWMKDSLNKFNELISDKSLPWHAELKLSTQGAFATLATLQIDKNNNAFSLNAIGDSCIFWYDREGIHLFPYRSVEEFQNRPFLLCSLPTNNLSSIAQQRQIVERFSTGSTLFFMATDALSCWFVNEYTLKKDPWEQLRSLDNQCDFEAFIKKLRNDMLIKNDDVTMLVIEYENSCEVESSDLSINESL